MGKEGESGPSAPQSEEAGAKRRGRTPAPRPQNVGDKDPAGYELVGKKDTRVMLKSPTGRFGVYDNCWTPTEKTLLRPTKNEDLAKSVLETGKVPEKAPAAPKKDD